MASTTPAGADRYFARPSSELDDAETYDEARRRVNAIDRLVRALEERREELGLSKPELAIRGRIVPTCETIRA